MEHEEGALSFDQKVALLVEQAPTLDPSTASFLLESSNGNVERAFALYGTPPPVWEHRVHIRPEVVTSDVAQKSPHPAVLPEEMHAYVPPMRAAPNLGGSRNPLPPRPRAPVSQQTASNRAVNGIRNLAWRVLQLPSAVISTGLGIAFSGVSLGFAVAAMLGDRILPSSIMTGMRGALATLTHPPEELDPASQARKFVLSFKAAYGDRHPRFVEAGFKQAVALAKSEFKFIFVYIHSSEHQDTDAFCSEVLCSPDLVTYINEHFVSWGGDVRYTDAFLMSSQLSVTGYPYIALLNTTPSNQVQLLAAIQGVTTPVALLNKLVQAVERHGAVLVSQRAELQEREFARRLREEQNAEYEQSLAADREREAKRQQQRQLEEEERRAKEEAEQKARAEEQAALQRQADIEQSISRRRQEKLASLPPEPVPHASPSSAGAASAAPLTALVRLRLPDGGSTQRRFLATHHMHHIFDFVDSLDSTTYLKYTLVSSFPRRVYTREEADVSLQEAGLAPQAALFVQPEEEVHTGSV